MTKWKFGALAKHGSKQDVVSGDDNEFPEVRLPRKGKYKALVAVLEVSTAKYPWRSIMICSFICALPLSMQK